MWTKCSDSLPTEMCLVYGPLGIDIADRDENKWLVRYAEDEWEEWDCYTPTHWMPLPEPPTAEGSGGATVNSAQQTNAADGPTAHA